MTLESWFGIGIHLGSVLENHLWQSTLFLPAMGMLTLLLRRNRASARHTIWLAASVKFLLPFALLVSLGSHFARPVHSDSNKPVVFLALQKVGEPFTPNVHEMHELTPLLPTPTPTHSLAAILLSVWLLGVLAVVVSRLHLWRRIASVQRQSMPAAEGREVSSLRRAESIAGVARPIDLLISSESFEPGVFGVFRPVLVWPEKLSERLDDAQLEAIFTHEIWHVRRRDNLAAVIQMLVETLFWFHPLVWWLSARLVEERERACDEAVMSLCDRRDIYAKGLLTTCKFCLETPLVCVSGVTGSDLKKRVLRIMSHNPLMELGASKKIVLASVALAAIGGPIIFGLSASQRIGEEFNPATIGPVPAFASVSVKRNRNRSNTVTHFGPEGITIVNLPPEEIIQIAYGQDFGDYGFAKVLNSHLVGGPSWSRDWLGPNGAEYEGYDIEAKTDPSLEARFGSNCGHQLYIGTCGYRRELMLMFQKVLENKFKLKLKQETRERPIYSLNVANGGPKFLETRFDLPAPSCLAGTFCIKEHLSTARLAQLLELHLDRHVVDETGLQGGYYFNLEWPRKPSVTGTNIAPAFGSQAALFRAVSDQLGLELKPSEGPDEFFVIEHVERPTEN